MSLTKGRFGHSHRQAEGRCHIMRPKHHGEIHTVEVSVAKQCPRFAGIPLAGKGPGSLLFEQVSEGSLTSGFTSVRRSIPAVWSLMAVGMHNQLRWMLWHHAGVAWSHWEAEADLLCWAQCLDQWEGENLEDKQGKHNRNLPGHLETESAGSIYVAWVGRWWGR